MRAQSPPSTGAQPPRRDVASDVASSGDWEAPLSHSRDGLDERFALVYQELRRLASRQLAAERADHTLSPSALVHESYLRLVRQRRVPVNDRGQFFGLAALAMRRILVDHARRHQALRRGGAWYAVSLDALDASDDIGTKPWTAVAQRADELLALDGALHRLAALDERLSRVVECRFFGGLTEAETAAVLGVTPRTVTRDWAKARGWLYQELRGVRSDA